MLDMKRIIYFKNSNLENTLYTCTLMCGNVLFVKYAKLAIHALAVTPGIRRESDFILSDENIFFVS